MASSVGDLVVNVSTDLASLYTGMAQAADIVSKAAADMGRQFDALGSNVGSLVGNIERLATVAVAGFSVKGIADMVTDSIAAQASLQDLAVRAGTTASQLSALIPAAALSGTSMDVVAQASARLDKALTSSGKNSAAAAAALQAIGISASSIPALLANPTQALVTIAQHLNEYADDGTKVAAVTALMGRGAAENLPFFKQLGDQLNVTSLYSNEQIAAAHNLVEQWSQVKLGADVLKATISASLVPALSDLLRAFTDTGSAANSLGGKLTGFATDDSFTVWALKIAEAIAVVIESFVAIGQAFYAFGSSVRVVGDDLMTLYQIFKVGAASMSGNQDALKQASDDLNTMMEKRNADIASANKAWSDLWDSNKTALSSTLDAELTKIESFNGKFAAAMAAQAALVANADARDIGLYGAAAEAQGKRPSTGYKGVDTQVDYGANAMAELAKQATLAQQQVDAVFSGQVLTDAQKFLATLQNNEKAWDSLTASQKAVIEGTVEYVAQQQRASAETVAAANGYQELAKAQAALQQVQSDSAVKVQSEALKQQIADAKTLYDQGVIDFDTYYAKITFDQKQSLALQLSQLNDALDAQKNALAIAQQKFLQEASNVSDELATGTITAAQAQLDLAHAGAAVVVAETGVAKAQGAVNLAVEQGKTIGSGYIAQWQSANSLTLASVKSLNDQVAAQDLANQAIGLTTAQYQQLIIAKNQDELATLQSISTDGMSAAAIDQLRGKIADLQAQIAARGNLASALGTGIQLQAMADGWKSLFQSAATEGASFIENFVTKGSSAFKTLWDDFKTWALDAFAKIAAQTIVVNIAEAIGQGTAAANTFAGGSGGLASLLTGGSNTLGGLSNIGSLLGLTNLGSGGIFASGGALSGLALGGVGQALGLSTTVGVNASLGGAAAGLTTFGTALGAVIPVLGAVLAVGSIAGLFSKSPSPVQGQFKVSPGTSGFEDNAYVASPFGNLGFNDANTQQFSGKGAEVFDNVVSGALAAFNTRFSPAEQQAFAATLHDMTFPVLSGTFTTQDFLQKYGGQVLQQIVVAAFQALDPALASVAAGFKGTADQVATFANSLLSVYDATKQIGNSDFTANVDAALQGADQATADKVVAFVSIVANFGDALPGVGVQLEALSGTDIPSFIEALGGAQAALSAFNYLNANFLTTAQQTAANSKLLTADFASLGLEVPKSHQAFLDLLSSIDLSTAAGRQEYAEILSFAPLFVQVFGTAQQAATSAATAATAAATAVQQLTVDVGSLTNAGIAQANKLLSNVQQLANAGTGDFGTQLSTQISLIADAMKTAGATLQSGGGYYYPNPGGAAGEQTTSYLNQLDATYQTLTDQLARYTVLAAQYGSAQAQQLVQLQDWLTQQNKLFAGMPTDLAAVQTIYQQKWDAIVNGTTAAVSGVQSQLASLQQSIADYLKSLVIGSLSPLTPQQQIAQAQQAYSQQLALAQGGDTTALQNITKYADSLLTLERGAYSSSQAYTDIFNMITTQLGDLAGTQQTGAPAGSSVLPTVLNTPVLQPSVTAALTTTGAAASALASSDDITQLATALGSRIGDLEQTVADMLANVAKSASGDADRIIAGGQGDAVAIVDGLGGTLK